MSFEVIFVDDGWCMMDIKPSQTYGSWKLKIKLHLWMMRGELPTRTAEHLHDWMDTFFIFLVKAWRTSKRHMKIMKILVSAQCCQAIQLAPGKYCKFGNFTRILFSRIMLKDIFAVLKFATRVWFTYISTRQSDIAISRGSYFHETSHMRSFAKIKLSPNFQNLQYQQKAYEKCLQNNLSNSGNFKMIY